MSPFSPSDAHNDPSGCSVFNDATKPSFVRRRWIAPTLAAHSTLTVVTQAPLPVPLNLLFLHASLTQCFNSSGAPVPCPP